VDILDAFRSDRPLELGDLAGNRFRIVVRDLPVEPEIAAKTVEETARALRIAGGFPSFFGIQRFGSIRPITHVVGRHLVRGEFREAVEAYVTNRSRGTWSYRPTRPGSRIEAGRSTSPATTWSVRQSGAAKGRRG